MPDDLPKLAIQLTARGDRVEVRSFARQGEAKAEIDLPPITMYTDLTQYDDGDIPQSTLKLAGQRLYEYLTIGDVGKLANAVLAEGKRLGEPVHIELRFDPDQVALARLPWELLVDEYGRTLVLEGVANITRYITYPQEPPRFEPAFNSSPLLRVIAQPSELPPISVSDLPLKRVLTLSHATFEEFKHRLLIERIRCWGMHFDGHGTTLLHCECGSDYGTDEALRYTSARCQRCGAALSRARLVSVLAFERDHNSHYVSTEEVGAVLYNSGACLAVLLACKSAQVGGRTLFSALAPGLILAGVPAVIGMQYNVGDSFANRFAHNFYEALTDRRDLLAAMQAARMMMREAYWYSPVLYLRQQPPKLERRLQAVYHTRNIDTATPAEVKTGEPFLVRLWIRRPETPAVSEDELRDDLGLDSQTRLSTRSKPAEVLFKPSTHLGIRLGEIDVELTAPGCDVTPKSIRLFVDEQLDAPSAFFTVQTSGSGILTLLFHLFQDGGLIASVTHRIHALDHISHGPVGMIAASHYVGVKHFDVELARPSEADDSPVSDDSNSRARGDLVTGFYGPLRPDDLSITSPHYTSTVELFEAESGSVRSFLVQMDEDARDVFEMALGEALRMGHFWVGLEFLLMGLSGQKEGTLATALIENGVAPSQLRGALRGLVDVRPEQKKTWRHQNAKTVDAEAWSFVQEIDPSTLAADFAAGKAPQAAVTPRMMAVLREAALLAGTGKVVPDHLLLAVLEYPESLAVNLLLNQVAQTGQDPRQWLAALLARAGSVAAQDLRGARPATRDGDDFFPSPRKPGSPQLPPSAGILAQLGRDLTAMAKTGDLRPAIGQTADRRMVQIAEILLQINRNAPLLLGDPGVGKTAIAEGFAWRLANDPNVVVQLAGRRIVDLSPIALLAGTKYRGDLEQRLQQILAEVRAANSQTIVFIDEIHTILGGKAEGGLGAISDALKPALSRGEFPCIGATTVAEYRRYIESDPALARRFTPVWIEEPSEQEAIQIAKTVVQEQLTPRHGVTYPDETVQEAVRLAVRYLHDEFLPGKAIKLLDQAGPRVILGGSLSGPKSVDAAIGNGEVSVEAVRAIVAERTGIPVTRLAENDRTRLKNLAARLGERIKGQDQAVQAVVTAVKRSRAGLGDPNRPQGVFLFAGPTGVGKTELALALAEALFDDENAILRLDMSEYLEKHQVSRLIGSPPGYIGYEEEGQLTGRLRRRPYSVVLLDEIEKAHPDVQHLFLQLFEVGRLTDSRGRLADGRHAIYIMTTNLGTREAMGFISTPAAYEQKLQEAIDQFFSPEFRNRIQRTIYFRPLDQAMLEAIFDKLFERAAERFRAQGIEVVVDAALKADLCRRHVSSKEGARPLERAIEDEIVAPLVDRLLDGDIRPGQRIVVGSDTAFAASDLPEPQAAPGPNLTADDLLQAEANDGGVGLDPREVRNRAALAPLLAALNSQLQAQQITLTVAESAMELLCSPFWQDQRRDLATANAFAEFVEKPLVQLVQAGEFQPGDQVEAFRDSDLAIALRKLEGDQT